MSVCLAVTKGVAVTSLGLYAGILTTGTVLCYSKPVQILISSLDIISQTQLNLIINNVATTTGILGALSSTCFAFSYFGLPKIWKHPYLVYGMLIPPIVSTYLCIYRASWNRKTLLSDDNNDISTIKMEDLDNSTVDLGKNHNSDNLKNTNKICKKIGIHLSLASILSTLGLLQSVVGLYGEGQF
ncbi:similar to Saccharomyces cerevisiae YGR049W SCM4 Potential regulatory effector of CDC4 function [Maudiozyma saulgeensis]|uniref:Similar to Saccharomyces cerevisiae YGR049W SCM4 Potential regulatory effector of CDC4 function n=1 Tax=Maudiozyma saulgeensis TaxID=1789683 RepID=A0A1X7RB03_9SACH|nr:similar to Saccharomyces cerevisiae YGR049W SCM4 Potential regulatory effector of CDC4 function [Kazachstania saulgeensis]